MTYNCYNGVKKRGMSKKLLILPLILLFGGGYILMSVMYPSLPPSVTGQSDAVSKVLTERQPAIEKDRLYVPKIGVDVEIVTGVSNETLEGGAWHRVPENGDPVTGGNFVLAAHRFNLGLTPNQSRAKSPFYHLDKMESGDQIFVDYKGVRYAYEVTKRYKVGANEVSIEKPMTDARMTMYTCDLRGWRTSREVIEAKPVGTVAWLADGPRINRAN